MKLTYRSLSCFYTLTKNYHKEKIRKQPIYSHIKKNKIPCNKSN